MWKETYKEKKREERRRESGYYGGSGTFIGTVSFYDGVEVNLEYKNGYVDVTYRDYSKKVGVFADSGPYCRAIEEKVRTFANNNGIGMPKIYYPWST